VQAEVELAEVRAGLRGALAARDFQAGESVISLPQSLVVHLASANSHAPVRAAHTRRTGSITYSSSTQKP